MSSETERPYFKGKVMWNVADVAISIVDTKGNCAAFETFEK
jgi:hypothetical protein